VLARRQLAALIPERSRAWIDRLLGSAELVSIAETIRACRDPDDDKFLELAVNGAADFIISGDADLLSLTAFRNIAIVTPALFLARLNP
jgi:putative PIN family toxin of toxin-antitoxin system